MKVLPAFALLGTALPAGCSKEDPPSILGAWRINAAYTVEEGPQFRPDTITLNVPPSSTWIFAPETVATPGSYTRQTPFASCPVTPGKATSCISTSTVSTPAPCFR